MKKPDLAIALDVADAATALRIRDDLVGLPIIYKIGLELYLSEGPAIVRDFVRGGDRVFLDLKLHDIPNTVRSAVARIAELGVEFTTLHVAGGRRMWDAAAEERNRSGVSIKLLGVSVLTSFDEMGWAEVSGVIGARPNSVSQSVRAMLGLVSAWPVDGLVCSALELPLFQGVSRAEPIYRMVPGVRPSGMAAGDQARVVTPSRARDLGADAIVVGRPILQADDPRKVVETILDELRRQP